MAETTSVALLFDDGELGGHLREALREGGARIVHEGPLEGLSRELIQRVGADVVVINLDDSSDEAFDRLDRALEGDHPRVVFNEAQSTRTLDGWDRARWARHLAAKVLARTDIDPPRPAAPEPEESASVAVPVAVVEPAVEPAWDEHVPADATTPGAEVTAPPPREDHEAETAAESESLEAELEALLAGDPLPGTDGVDDTEEADEAGLSIDESIDFNFDLPEGDEPLYDGNFLDATAGSQPPVPSAMDELDELADDALDTGLDAEPAADASDDQDRDAFTADTLALTKDLNAQGGEDEMSLADPGEAMPHGGKAPTPAPSYRVPDSWSLVDDDTPAAPPAVEAARPDPSEFGVEKVSAADYLAPDAESDESELEPFLSLELVSMEEAIAPKEYAPNEMMLDDLGSALTRVVMIGATVGSRASVREFLSKLPAGMRITIVHTQHVGDRSADELAEELARSVALPVRMAAHGQVARVGELLVVPPDAQLRLMRDGKIELKSTQDLPSSSPSIDANFTTAAGVFGSDALAILFAGQANDALAGCQAIRDRGGRVWVEDAPGEHFADMVSGVLAERLADFSGTPADLAARLIEEY